ncbi:MAG: quinohemoprotein amine dehydrogenase subunit beta, partial [Gammaproteobacteria bacterium]|nr:quinohemoprotein amine dehydrogenase subunit beta [Gammaproteobacteria bacterium]
MRLPLTLLALSCLVTVAACQRSTDAPPGKTGPAERDYMLTVSRPNTLNLIDLHENKIVRQCELPGAPTPGTVVLSPDKTLAYVLADGFSDVYGFRLDDCELVFSTRQSSGNLRVKSFGSLAISPDGGEIYTHQNRVKLLNDHYLMQAPLVAVFDTSAGLNTPALRSFEAPRQVTIMATGADGQLYLGGPDIYRMDVTTGEYDVALRSRSLEDPAYGARDILSVWPLGEVNGELIRMYSVAKYRNRQDDEEGDPEDADFLWGYERVDLQTGETESQDFGPLEVVLFTSMRRPGHLDQVYGVLNELKVFDV